MSTTAQQQFQIGSADPGPAPVGYITVYPRVADGQLESQDENGVKSILGTGPMTGDSGSGGASGSVPAPGAGDAAAGKFLKASGYWEAPTLGGPAGGDLTGTYPNPTVGAGAIGDAKISDVDFNKVTNAPTSYPPNGAAGGDLTGTYPTPQIASGAVTTAKLHDGAIISTKFATGAVNTAAILDGAVTDAKIASVDYAKLTGAPSDLPPSGAAGGSLAGSYPNPTLAADSVDTAQLVDDAVSAAKIAHHAVTTDKINELAVTTGKLDAGAVTNAKVDAAAGIHFTKMEALTADKALVTNGSGTVSPSSITATELGYLAGVTGAVQGQLNGKLGSLLGAITEKYAPILSGDTINDAILKLIYSSTIIFSSVSTDVLIGDGFEWVRGKTKVLGTSEIRITGTGRLHLI